MNRRDTVLALIALGAAPLAAEAQQAGKVWRVGILTPGLPPPGPLDAIREGLRELGYVEGQNIVIDWRFAEERNERLPRLARELVALAVDCIVAVNTPAAKAAKNATGTVPIVIVRLADPVETGLVASLARPGGNITGLTAMPQEMAVKRLDLMKELLPGLTRVAVIWNAANPGHPPILRDMNSVSERLGIELQSLSIRGVEDLAEAFEAVTRTRAGALLVIDDVLLTSHRRQILDFAAKRRLPVSAFFREFAEAGALVTYGPSIPVMYRRVAYFVDRIFRGARPAETPIEQPTTFELIINLKTAKALGLTIPQLVLLRADRVIE